MKMETRERVQQKMRTRRDLIAAATGLLVRGEVPTVPSVAEEANVSRGTVYRFFPSQQSLLAETLRSVSVSLEELHTLFERSAAADDPEQRLRVVCTAVYGAFARNEAAFRAFLRYSLEESDVPPAEKRVKGRFMWIDAALEPVAPQLEPERLAELRIQLAVLLGIEPFIVYRDICGLSNEAAAATAAGTAVLLLRCALAELPRSK